jgi:hypothetical protein
LTALSLLPDARVRPSGLKATELIQRVCPVRIRSSQPVATSQSWTVPSAPPDARVRPSGLKATEVTISECPLCTTSSGLWGEAVRDNKPVLRHQ